MLYVLIACAVVLYGVYLFKKIKAFKQDKNKKCTCECDKQVDSTKVENEK